jgi:outer membrane murein-binding lipoprotein Lpp
MKKKTITILTALTAILVLLVAGCSSGISEADYNRVISERDQARAQVTALEGEIATLEGQIAVLEEQSTNVQEELDAIQEQKVALEEQVTALSEQIASLQQTIARNFVINSPTFAFDGIEDTLELIASEELAAPNTWQYTYEFQSRHAGYGDRTGQMLLMVITPHEAVITVVNGEVASAIMDGKWDMIKQEMLAEAITEEEARQIAEDFVRNSPTFAFDGIEDTLQLGETLYPDIENAWQFVFQFESRHAGYGDRTGQMLAEVITPHEAIITVERGQVVSAIMDEQWNMLTQSIIFTEEASRQIAEEFVLNSPTFVFDGIENTLVLTNTAAFTKAVISPDAPAHDTRGWEFTFEFESRHAGYGDRTGQVLAQVITPHEAVITVEQGEVTSAVMDGEWDMINQEMLND